MDKTIRRVTDPEEEQAETYRYWHSLPIGDRLVAISELSQEAYAFAAAFKGAPAHDEQGLSGDTASVQRARS